VANLTVFLQRLTKGLAAKALGGLPDRELLQRFAARHEETAFEAIVRRHGPMVLRVCWRVLRQSQDAEDAFLLLARSAGAVRKPDSLASWLHGAARRVALKARTRRAARRRHEERYAATAGLPADAGAEQILSNLDEELTRLPEQWRLPLIVCYLEGRTQDEAAARLGWSTLTFRRRLDEARAELGRRLVRRGVAPSAALSVLLLSDAAVSAAVPARLAASTVEAGARVAAGRSAAGVVSAEVLVLTEGVRTAMLMNSLKTIVVLALLAAAVATGAWVLEGRAAQLPGGTPGVKSTPGDKEALPSAGDGAKARTQPDVVTAAEKYKLAKYKVTQSTENKAAKVATSEYLMYADLKSPRYRDELKGRTFNDTIEYVGVTVRDDKKDRCLRIVTEKIVPGVKEDDEFLADAKKLGCPRN
jgi:RNA polymerase sigma-70 factor (ECF subfamily)